MSIFGDMGSIVALAALAYLPEGCVIPIKPGDISPDINAISPDGSVGLSVDATAPNGVSGGPSGAVDGAPVTGVDGASLMGMGSMASSADANGDPDVNEDPGGSWTAVTANLVGLPSVCGTLVSVSSKPDEDFLIATVVQQGLWGSMSGATTWTQLAQGAGSEMFMNGTSSILYDPSASNTFWQSGSYGPCVYKTTDDGQTFVHLGNAQSCDSVSVDLTDPARQTMIAGAHEKQTVWRSTDSGQTWIDVGGNIESGAGYTGFVLTVGSQIHLVSSWSSSTAGIFRSSDGGQTFARVFSGGIRSRPLVSSDGIYWVLNLPDNNSGMIKSTDQGLTWNLIGGANQLVGTEAGPVELPDHRLVNIGATNLMISADRGVTWNPLGPALPFVPWGMAYSTFRKAFYVWYFTCNSGTNPVQADAIVSWPFDYSTQ